MIRFSLRLLSCLCLTALSAFAGEVGPFTGPEADAEAARLYERANAFVRNVHEGPYSYAYVQFHWKRAGANLDRIRTAYPSSPTAKKLAAGELRLGEFEPGYFKQRVLPRLEEKKVAAFDAVNCAIFLYTDKQNQNEAGKKLLLEQIITTLCRQTRWSEALSFPVIESDRAWLFNVVERQAAIYRNDKLVDELLANVLPPDQPMLRQSQAEGLGFRGETAVELEKFLAANPTDSSLRIGVLRGLVRRQKHLDRARQVNRPLKGLYDGVDGVQHPDDNSLADLQAFYATFGAEPPAEARAAYARYLAFLGKAEEAAALKVDRSAYVADSLDWLISQERYADAIALARRTPGATADLVFLLARAGRTAEVAAVLKQAGETEELIYARSRGELHSTEKRLTVREHTFGDLPLKDPNYIGRLICEWSLTPNRALRGAAPWDAIIFKFAPGFANLPEPKDQRKVDAAGR